MPISRVRTAAAIVVAFFVAVGGCASVPQHLKLPSLDVKDPTFQATLVAYTGSAVVGGNRIDVLLNGDQIFPAKLQIIRNARSRSEERRVGKGDRAGWSR